MADKREDFPLPMFPTIIVNLPTKINGMWQNINGIANIKLIKLNRGSEFQIKMIVIKLNS